MTFRILMLGDIIGRPGRRVVREKLPDIIKKYEIDTVVANGENASGGKGLIESAAKDLISSGIDVLTSGNHIWNRKEIFSFIDKFPQILRPANFPDNVSGRGSYIFEHKDKGLKIGIINLIGRVFMSPVDSPFTKAVTEIEKLKSSGSDIIIIDFHAEATAEKEALGLYLADKIELFAGTHTHVQTSDEKILNGRCGYITDLGRCGSFFSVLGFDEKDSIKGYLTNIPQSFTPAKEDLVIEGIIAGFDETSKKCTEIRRIREF
ncbi:MAG TPA: TIGR00282 family metallophosphoesterase [bacterium]|nr:TIGR00282 family metallophosphoesterase [bacterium]